jgi:hypothetical protein
MQYSAQLAESAECFPKEGRDRSSVRPVRVAYADNAAMIDASLLKNTVNGCAKVK